MYCLERVVRKGLEYINLGHMYPENAVPEELELMINQETVVKLIPKQIHFVWLGSALPELYKQNIQTWMVNNPDYEFHLWIDSAAICLETAAHDLKVMQDYCEAVNVKLHDIHKRQDFLVCVKNPAYHDLICGEDASYAFAADYLRLIILYLCGGIYADLDTVCREPLGELCNEQGFFAWGKNAGIIDNCFIAATVRHAVILACIERRNSNYQLFINKACVNNSEDINVYNKYRFKTHGNSEFRINLLSAISTIQCMNETLDDVSQCVFAEDQKVTHSHAGSWRLRDEKKIGILGVDEKGNPLKLCEENMHLAITREQLKILFYQRMKKLGAEHALTLVIGELLETKVDHKLRMYGVAYNI